MKKFLIATVTYNPSEDIKESIFKPEYDSLVVDNSIEPQPWLSQYCINKNITYIVNNANLGIATALNIACQYAIDHGYKWIITMDQDSVITKDIIDKMLEFADKYPDVGKVAIISPRHVLQNGVKIPIANEDKEYSEGLSTMTSGNLLNLSVWQKIGGFRDDFFIDMVDWDYYCRAMVNGYKVITLNQVHMQHSLGEMKTGKILGREIIIYNHDFKRKYYQVRNGLIVYRQYRKTIPQVIDVLKFLKGVTISLFFEKDKLRKAKFMVKGIIDFLRNKTGTLDVIFI